MAEVFDHLGWDRRRLKHAEERVLFSGEMQKVNEHKKVQIRNLVITNAYLYNYKREKLKAFKSIEWLVGIVRSYTGDHFVLQFSQPENCDYHYIGNSEEVYTCLKSLFPGIILLFTEADEIERFRRFKSGKNSDRLVKLTDFKQRRLTVVENPLAAVLVFARLEEVTIEDLMSYQEYSMSTADDPFIVIKMRRVPGYWYLQRVRKGRETIEEAVKTAESDGVFGPLMFIVSHAKEFALYYEYRQTSEVMTRVQSASDTSKLEIVRRVAYDISVCLDHLHSQRFVYQRLIPSNILYASGPEHAVFCLRDPPPPLSPLSIVLKIGDREIYCAEYMSKEFIFMGRYSVWSDWWGLGVLLWEMIVGKQPFLGAADLTEAIATGVGVDIPEQYSDARNFIWRLMKGESGTPVLQHPFLQKFTEEASLRSSAL